MRKFAITLLVSMLLAGVGFCQTAEVPAFDSTDFAVKSKLAEWLVNYNQVALITADSLRSQNSAKLQQIGKEWFCFQDSNSVWHAVYGRFRHGSYNVLFHFIVNGNNAAYLTRSRLDSSMVTNYARALYTAGRIIKPLMDSLKMSMVRFIRQNEDKTFTVWIFPGLQPEGYAIYGGEFVYTFSADGKKVIGNSSYFSGKFRAVQVDRPQEISLDYSELQQPTIGSLFFVWNYKPYFTRINIQNAHYTITAINGGGAYFWAHFKRKKAK
ncbi:MAG TPA: hypothetical protein VMV56_02055 [Williamwhitmania sp.]|nr:hypothetical protein [Williamwhitmania sp.]